MPRTAHASANDKKRQARDRADGKPIVFRCRRTPGKLSVSVEVEVGVERRVWRLTRLLGAEEAEAFLDVLCDATHVDILLEGETK